MKIIRDEDGLGIFMIPLFVDWQIRRCNVKDCKEIPTTIIAGLPDNMPPIGMCENDYQKGASKGKMNYSIEYDGFDAFQCAEQL